MNLLKIYLFLTLTLFCNALFAIEEPQVLSDSTCDPQVHTLFVHPHFKKHESYALFFESNPNFPKTVFTFVNFPINQPLKCFIKRNMCPIKFDYEWMNTFTILPDGTFYEEGHIVEFYYLDSFNFLPGERIYNKFTAKEPSFLYEFSFIPYRLVAGDDQFSIEAELFSVVPATVYVIFFNGVEEGEILNVTSVSNDEKIEFSLKCTAEHKIIHLPGVEGKMGGNNVFKVTRSDGTYATLTLPWGMEFVHYLK